MFGVDYLSPSEAAALMAERDAARNEAAELRRAARAMRVYLCSDFEGHYPVGAAAVVVAQTPEQARDALKSSLRQRGLSGYAHRGCEFMLVELDVSHPSVQILVDGNY